MSNLPGARSTDPEPPAFEPVEFRDSWPFYLTLLVAMVALTVCSVAYWAAWGPVPLFFFGSAAVVAGLRVFRRLVRLQIDEEGILDI